MYIEWFCSNGSCISIELPDCRKQYPLKITLLSCRGFYILWKMNAIDKKPHYSVIVLSVKHPHWINNANKIKSELIRINSSLTTHGKEDASDIYHKYILFIPMSTFLISFSTGGGKCSLLKCILFCWLQSFLIHVLNGLVTIFAVMILCKYVHRLRVPFLRGAALQVMLKTLWYNVNIPNS